MKKSLIIMVLIFGVAAMAYSVDTLKPSTHNTAWEYRHGQAAKTNEAECMSCHVERLECISCHEDKAPRTHTPGFVQKTHGLESRWDRNSCQTCHKEDFCSSCHETAVPLSHSRANFFGGNGNVHCTTGCQLPRGNWKNTPSKNCIMCHDTRPILDNGNQHQLKK